MARTKKATDNVVSKAVEIAKKKGYEEIGGGDITGWEKGMIIEGEIIKVRNLGKNKGNLLDMRIDGERRTIGCPTILYNRINELDNIEGTEIIIECLGKIHTENGDAWNFRLFANTK